MSTVVLKKILAVLMAAATVAVFASCGKKEVSNPTDPVITTEAPSLNEENDVEENEEDLEPANKIDLEGLKAIEAADAFEVKITKKEVIEDAVSGISLEGNDACVFTVENGTDGEISDIEIYAVAYTEKEGLVRLSQGSYVVGNYSFIQTITSEDEYVIAPGETLELAVKCRTEDFAGVRAIVASYVSADGVKHENPSADEWVKAHELGKITELD